MKILKRILIGFAAILVILNVLIWAFDITYIYKALVYQNPGIDDLNIFPYRTVAKSAISEPWAKSADYNKKPLSAPLRKMLEDNQTVAYLVIQNDSIIQEEYWENYTDTSTSNSFSVAKSVISILIGIAIDEGKITSVNDPVGKYLPEFANGEKEKITIKHLLQMASGLNFMESYSSPINKTTEAYYGTDLKKLIYGLEVIEIPGTIHRYKSGDTQLLELVLKAATGSNVSDYAATKLWAKIGTEQNAQWSTDTEGGDEKAYCCFYASAHDFARIGKLYMQNGCWDTTQVVSAEWVKASITPNGLTDEEGQKTDYYGYQWWLTNVEGHEIFYARGLAGQYIINIPDKKLIIVRLGRKRTDKKINHLPEDVATYITEALKVY